MSALDAHFTAEEKTRAQSLRRRWMSYEMRLRFGEASVETVLEAYRDYLSVHEAALQRAFEAREGGKILRDNGFDV